jgi:hypothetical protein
MPALTKLETLIKWFEENEIDWDKSILEVRDTNNSLGVFAKSDIEEGSPGKRLHRNNLYEEEY